eukprot:s233_g14.t1
MLRELLVLTNTEYVMQFCAPRAGVVLTGRSTESSRASTPKCPVWSIVDPGDEAPRPKPPKPTHDPPKKVPLQRLTRAVSQPPVRPKPIERSSGSGDASRASTPADHWDEPSDFVEEVTAYPENPRFAPQVAAKPPSLGEASAPSSPGQYFMVFLPEPAAMLTNLSIGIGAKSPKPWKQKAIQVNSAEHYLEALKAARGQSSAKACAKSRPTPGTKGYAEQLRLRAEDVEAKQREDEDVRMERGYAALQRVQQRALQASPMREARAG